MKRDDVTRMEKALVDHNDLLLSASAIADRSGEQTNWNAFRSRLYAMLKHHRDITDIARHNIAHQQKGRRMKSPKTSHRITFEAIERYDDGREIVVRRVEERFDEMPDPMDISDEIGCILGLVVNAICNADEPYTSAVIAAAIHRTRELPKAFYELAELYRDKWDTEQDFDDFARVVRVAKPFDCPSCHSNEWSYDPDRECATRWCSGCNREFNPGDANYPEGDK